MKKTLFLVSCIALLGFGCSISPSGIDLEFPSANMVEKTVEIGSFSNIDLGDATALNLTQGDEVALTVSAPDNLIDNIQAEVVGETLFLGVEETIEVFNNKNITFTLTAPDLEEFDIHGASSVNVGPFETTNLVAEISGASSVEFEELTVKSSDISISGASTVEIAGTANQQILGIGGASTYKAGDFTTETMTIDMDGASTATVRANISLDMTVDGASTLKYYGSPTITQDISGASSVKGLD